MRHVFALVPLVLLLYGVSPVLAQDTKKEKEDPAHDELRALKEKIHKAYDAGNIDELMTYFTDDAVVTWQNGKETVTPKAIKAYMDEMSKGDKPPVKKATIEPKVADWAHLYGDTAVAYGTSKDFFLLRDGTEFTQDSRWTATLVKQNGHWKVAGLHVSVNMFDNPILTMAEKKVAIYGSGAGAAAGLVLGIALTVIVGRFRKAS